MTDQWASEYSCLAADPPWPERGGGKIKRGADRHYSLIKKKEEILDVMLEAPCWRPAERAHLWMWTTHNYLPWALWLYPELGFKYVTMRVWAKMALVDDCDDEYIHSRYRDKMLYEKQRPGLGQYLRHEDELLLLGVRGKPALRAPKGTAWVGTLLLEPRTKVHSQKPEQAYFDMELVTPSIGPRLEMFAGPGDRPGWDKWRPMVHR